jgi:hypothetical protein
MRRGSALRVAGFHAEQRTWRGEALGGDLHQNRGEIERGVGARVCHAKERRGVRSGAAPRGEEAGEGPGPTDRRRAARAGGGWRPDRGGWGADAWVREPQCGRQHQIRFEIEFQTNSNQFQSL